MRTSVSSFADIVSFADPASGKTGSAGVKRCRTAIVTVAQLRDGTAFWLDAVAGVWPTNSITEEIYRAHDKWHARRFGVESSGQQNLYVDSLIRDAITRRKRITIVPVEQPTNQTKEFRIETEIQLWLHNGLLYINRNLTDGLKELEAYPQGRTCDIVDALASALHMLRSPFANKKGVHVQGSNDDKPMFETYRRA